MVAMARVAAPVGGFGAPMPSDVPEAGGTMVGIPLAGRPSPQGFGFAPPPASPSGPPPSYDILSHLGGGELGQVFHARHRETGHEYALRIVRPDIAAVPGALDALRDVVALSGNAAHAHLGRQLELDESASPTLVVEYVAGKTLAAIMSEKGAAPAPAVIDLGVRLCSALAAAHGAGLAHGRVHAGNVMLENKSGRWVLLDLGHGYAVQPLDPAHDLYALGAMLYEMATGHSPFEREGEPVPDPRTHKPQLPAALSALIMRTLASDPAMWFANAVELAQALARARGQA
jgi:serine/threonine-protein kinase